MFKKLIWPALALALPALIMTNAESHEIAHHDMSSAEAHHGLEIDSSDDIRSLLTAFRETGDDQYLDAAWTDALAALKQDPDSVDRLIDAAMIAQARHNFAFALERVNEAIHGRPHNDQAWILLASIQLVRGDTISARHACGRLRQLPILLIATCYARVDLADGNADRAKQKLDALLSITDPLSLRPGWLAWSLSIAGDLAAAVGEHDHAIDRYQSSLELAQNTQVRSALADVLIEEGRLEAAQDVLAAAAPALPIVVRRLIVATRMGLASDYQADIEIADNKFQSWIEKNDWLHAREMARFYLDVELRPKLAMQLARINLEIQKEPEDYRLVARSSGQEEETGHL